MKLTGIASVNLLVFLAYQNGEVQAKLGGSYAPGPSATEEGENENLAEALPHLHLRDDDDKRNLQVELEMYGGNPGSEFIPLALCEGDCDDDNDVSYAVALVGLAI